MRVSSSGEQLVITDVHRADKGVYQCMARNERDSAQASAELRLGGKKGRIMQNRETYSIESNFTKWEVGVDHTAWKKLLKILRLVVKTKLNHFLPCTGNNLMFNIFLNGDNDHYSELSLI